MTENSISVTKQRDRSSVTQRDTSRAHALLKQGCHDVTGRDVTQPSVTDKRDSHGVTGFSALRLPGDRCTDCQVGQGRNCACRAQVLAARKPRRSLWDMSCSTFWRGYVLGLVLCWALGYWGSM